MRLRPFELVLVVVFGLLAFSALIILRIYSPDPDEGSTVVGEFNIWGTVPSVAFENVLKKIQESDESFKNVNYKYIPEDQIDERFITALADQKSPDLIFLNHERLVEQRSRLQAFSYKSFPLRDYKSNYIDATEIFALNEGIFALPVVIDPLVMYWNRDLFSAQGLITPPKTWEEIVSSIVPALTVKDYNRNISKASIAMGEYSNIKNAFAIISTLFLQSGSALVTENNQEYTIRLNESLSNIDRPFSGAVTFFTNFSNINNTLYTWNRALRTDYEMFISEDLAVYFGKGSEGRDLAIKNPNLNFDVAEVPQGEGATVKRTYGSVYGFAIPKSAKNKGTSLLVAQTLSSSENSANFALALGMAPVQRPLIVAGSNDTFARVSYNSAVFARGWLNPDLTQVTNIFTKMIDDINSNRRVIYYAIDDTIGRLQLVY